MRILCLRDRPLANWLDYSALFISAPVACAPQCVSTVPHQGLFLTSIVDDLRNGRGASRIPHPQAPVPRVPDLPLQTIQSNPSHTRAGAYVVRLRVPNPPLWGRADSRGHGDPRNAQQANPPAHPEATDPLALRRCHRRYYRSVHCH